MNWRLAFFLLCHAGALLADNPFKVVGYLPAGRFNMLDELAFQRLTHVNLAFVNPDNAGNLGCEGADIDPVVAKAHQHGCQVFMSLGGGYLTPEAEAAWGVETLPANRPAFIAKLVQYVQQHDLDGVDVDLEWQYVHDWYSPFILELKAALVPLNVSLTAALPGSWRYPEISPAALAAFDWVNMMAYDLTGPWAPGNPGQHSPYDWAASCIPYWTAQGVAAEKLTLGVPFYGYDFGQSPVGDFTYGEIVAEDPANALLDASGMRYWNGIPTIQAKTQLALDEIAGVMIWEIGGDAFGADSVYSLLKVIDDMVSENALGAPEANVGRLDVYPNPSRGSLYVRSPGGMRGLVRVFDLRGVPVLEKNDPGSEVLELDVSALPPGPYVLCVASANDVQRVKFIRY